MSTRTRKKVKAVIQDAGGDSIEPHRREWVLPATAAAYDAMVEQMAMELALRPRADIYAPKAELKRMVKNGYLHEEAEITLRAIGITRPPATKQTKDRQ